MVNKLNPKVFVTWLENGRTSMALSYIMLTVALFWLVIAIWSFRWSFTHSSAAKAALIAWMVYP